MDKGSARARGDFDKEIEQKASARPTAGLFDSAVWELQVERQRVAKVAEVCSRALLGVHKRVHSQRTALEVRPRPKGKWCNEREPERGGGERGERTGGGCWFGWIQFEAPGEGCCGE